MDHTADRVNVGGLYIRANVCQLNIPSDSEPIQKMDNNENQTQSEYKHSLTFCIPRYVVIVTKPVHRLKICPIMHKHSAPPTIPPSYIRVRAVVWECGEGQSHRYTDGRGQHSVCLGYVSREM